MKMSLVAFKYYRSSISEYDISKDESPPTIPKTLTATFSYANSLRYLILDNLNTENLVSIRSMCSNCYYLEYVRMLGWDVKRLINCDFCFANCPNLLTVEIEWKHIRDDINCFLSMYNSPCVKVISEEFAFNKNTEKPCPLY